MSTIQSRKEIRREIFALILPIIMENVFQVSANLVTVAMIGRLSPLDISAQGIVMRLTETLNSLFRGVAVGATVYIAKSYGAKSMDNCFKIFKQTILSATPLALLFASILFAFPTNFLHLLTDKAELIAVGTGYMRLTVLGLPFVAIMAFVTSTFQGHSNTKTPMLIAMLVNISNIILGYVLIFGVGGIGGFGIYGAAAALSASRAIGAITGLILLFKGPFRVFSTEQLKGKRFQYDWVCIKDVYSTGIPAALENFFWQFSAIIMSRAILTYGEVSFSAYQIGLQAEDISGMATFGFGVAATTLSAKAIGMRDGELFRSYFREDVRLCSTISVFTSLALILLPTVFMSLMTNNPEIQRIGAVYVFVMGFIQIPQNLSGILSKTLLSSGYKNTPMIISFVGIWLIRIPLALLVTYVLKWDVLFIWLCIALDQLSRFIINVVIMKRKNVLYTAVR